jgi:hypothetical protein
MTEKAIAERPIRSMYSTVHVSQLDQVPSKAIYFYRRSPRPKHEFVKWSDVRRTKRRLMPPNQVRPCRQDYREMVLEIPVVRRVMESSIARDNPATVSNTARGMPHIGEPAGDDVIASTSINGKATAPLLSYVFLQRSTCDTF